MLLQNHSQRRMRIAVVAHGLTAAGGRSVATNVVRSLLRQRDCNDYLLFVPPGREYEFAEHHKNVKVVYCGPFATVIGRAFYDNFVLPRTVRGWGPDLIFHLGNYGFRHPGAFQAILFHKAHFVYPNLKFHAATIREQVRNWLIKRQLRLSLSHTQLVFCQTQTVRDKFKSIFEFKGTVALMPNAVSFEVMNNDIPAHSVRHVVEALSGTKRLLVMSRYYPHKNLEAVIKTFAMYKHELHGVSCILTVGRDDHPMARKLLASIGENGLSRVIVNVGPVAQSCVGWLYENSEGVLLPTLLESFSSTYLEALFFDKPIITSARDFGREACGDAAIYFEPTDVKSIADAIVRFRDDEVLLEELSCYREKQRNDYSSDWDAIVDRAMKTVYETMSGQATSTARENS